VRREPRHPRNSCQPGTAAAIGGPELLDIRVAQLEHGTEPTIGTVTARRLLLTVAENMALIASCVAAIALAGGPAIVTKRPA
jgi:hypothetical protein